MPHTNTTAFLDSLNKWEKGIGNNSIQQQIFTESLLCAKQYSGPSMYRHTHDRKKALTLRTLRISRKVGVFTAQWQRLCNTGGTEIL